MIDYEPLNKIHEEQAILDGMIEGVTGSVRADLSDELPELLYKLIKEHTSEPIVVEEVYDIIYSEAKRLWEDNY